jgi:hypothetical protein
MPTQVRQKAGPTRTLLFTERCDSLGNESVLRLYLSSVGIAGDGRAPVLAGHKPVVRKNEENYWFSFTLKLYEGIRLKKAHFEVERAGITPALPGQGSARIWTEGDWSPESGSDL